jgi:predicted AlkP superfamily phosphohydrolase/phosphomutase
MVVIGLDGATLDIVIPLAMAGYLPSLRDIMSQGVHGPLRSWPNTNSEAGWSSLITGCNPGQHGIYRLVMGPEGGHQPRLARAADRRKDPFWRLLSAAGLSVGVINVPLTYPVDPVNGFMLSGMHTPHRHSPGFSHPPDLADELQRHGIDYVIDVPDLPTLCYQDPQRALREAQCMVQARCDAIRYLMRTRPWDVLIAVFTVTDILQHFFWPKEGAPVEGDDWAPLRTIFQQIDAFLGDAERLIDENTTVLVVSDHGFGPARLARYCLNQLFVHLGLLSYRQGDRRPRSWLLKNLLGYGRRLVPQRIQGTLARALPRLHSRALRASDFAGVDWSHTVAYAGQHGGRVHINLAGREVEGVVAPGEYEPLREQIQDILLSLTDPATGHRVVRGVIRREDVYQGPLTDQAPDLLVEWETESVGDALCYSVGPEPIVVRLPEDSPARRAVGSHAPEGIFIARGPQIRRGATLEGACLYDIAPTILYLQGQPIPRDMDGDVLTGILTDERL